MDIRVEDCGSIVTFLPVSDEARHFFDANVASEGWQWFGGALCVDRRYASDLLEGLKLEGFTFEV